MSVARFLFRPSKGLIVVPPLREEDLALILDSVAQAQDRPTRIEEGHISVPRFRWGVERGCAFLSSFPKQFQHLGRIVDDNVRRRSTSHLTLLSSPVRGVRT